MRKSGKLRGKGHKTPGPGVQGRFSEMFSCSCVRWESDLPTYLVVTGVGAKDTTACKKRRQTVWQISYINNFLYIRLCRVDRSTLAEDWWSALGGGSPWLITYKGVAPTQHFFPKLLHRRPRRPSLFSQKKLQAIALRRNCTLRTLFATLHFSAIALFPSFPSCTVYSVHFTNLQFLPFFGNYYSISRPAPSAVGDCQGPGALHFRSLALQCNSLLQRDATSWCISCDYCSEYGTRMLLFFAVQVVCVCNSWL